MNESKSTQVAPRVTWDAFYAEPIDVSRSVSWVHSHFPMIEPLLRASRVLEVGTGTGSISSFVSRWCDLSVSIDVSRAVLETSRVTAAGLRGRASLVRGDAFALPFADRSFDATYSQGLYEHFDDEQIHRLVAEQARVADTVYISVPNNWYPHLGSHGPGLVGNERLMSSRRWATILKRWSASVESYGDPKALSFAGVRLGPKIHTLITIRSV